MRRLVAGLEGSGTVQLLGEPLALLLLPFSDSYVHEGQRGGVV